MASSSDGDTWYDFIGDVNISLAQELFDLIREIELDEMPF